MRFRATNDEVSAAMAAVPRVHFLPEDVRHLADEDHALPVGYGQTNSQPHTVANMLRLLGAEPGHKILDVGAGTGWTTALLGELVGETGEVIGVELVPQLAKIASDTLRRFKMPWATVRVADPEVLGAPEEGPYDRILVSAEAVAMPQQLIDQLKVGAVMVVPVAGEMVRVVKAEHDYHATKHGPYRFVPLL